uniref:Cyclin-Q n=1 Tax=Strigamia maritima TaxID=126957 RepID=T1JK71_STRMM
MALSHRSRHFELIRYIFEVGTKLNAQHVSIATASCLYHKFFENCNSKNYDHHMIAATCVYLAGKVEEDHFSIKDVINVAYKTLHKESGPLEPGEKYHNLRKSIVHLELLILRVLKFKVSFVDPRKYLLHYVKSLQHWLHPSLTEKVPILQTSWALIQDFLHDPVYLKYKAQHIAIGALYLALQCCGIQVPYNEDAVLTWYETFADDLTKEELWEIVEDIMSVSLMEN